jgi:hypothetical protein
MKSAMGKFWCRRHADYALKMNYDLFKDAIQEAIVDPSKIFDINIDDEDVLLNTSGDMDFENNYEENEENIKSFSNSDNLSDISFVDGPLVCNYNILLY